MLIRNSLIGESSNLGKRSADEAASSEKKPRREKDDSEKVRIVEEDFEGIDTANILPRSRRKAAISSGLSRPEYSRPNSAAAPPKTSSSSSSKPTKKHNDSDDDEAEF